MAEDSVSRSLDWDEVRRCYEATSMRVADIRRRFGISEWQFRSARETRGWTVRRQAVLAGPFQGMKAGAIGRLALKLQKLWQAEFSVLEGRFAERGELTDGEVRIMVELALMLEPMLTMRIGDKAVRPNNKNKKKADRDGNARNGGGGDDAAARADHLARLRAEIARRLERLPRSPGPGEARR